MHLICTSLYYTFIFSAVTADLHLFFDLSLIVHMMFVLCVFLISLL